MPTTANGLPYPTNSEPLANGAAAVQALAAAVDPRIWGGALAGGVDLNTVTQPGTYVDIPATSLNRPPTAVIGSFLLVFASAADGSVVQVYFARTMPGFIYLRNRWGGVWTGWFKIATAAA